MKPSEPGRASMYARLSSKEDDPRGRIDGYSGDRGAGVLVRFADNTDERRFS